MCVCVFRDQRPPSIDTLTFWRCSRHQRSCSTWASQTLLHFFNCHFCPCVTWTHRDVKRCLHRRRVWPTMLTSSASSSQRSCPSTLKEAQSTEWGHRWHHLQIIAVSIYNTCLCVCVCPGHRPRRDVWDLVRRCHQGLHHEALHHR